MWGEVVGVESVLWVDGGRVSVWWLDRVECLRGEWIGWSVGWCGGLECA